MNRPTKLNIEWFDSTDEWVPSGGFEPLAAPHSIPDMLEILDKITAFVSAYPHVAYGLVFIVALVEAMPVAGVIVPGSMMIIAVSALVPSGAVAFWPLIGSAVVGAVIGDGFSYWLGRRSRCAS